jgi:hypothetical protein
MNREDLVTMLDNLEAEGKLSSAQADAILAAYDAGQITEEDLPLSPQEGSTGLPTALALAALLYALLKAGFGSGGTEGWIVVDLWRRVAGREATGPLLEARLQRKATQLLEGRDDVPSGSLPEGTRTAREQARDRSRQILRGMSKRERDRLARDFRDLFFEEADRRTARMLFSDRYDDGLRRWQVAAREMVRDDIMSMAAMGKGRPLTAADLNRLGEEWKRQQAHLQRFAEEIAARRAAGNPMTQKQIAARLKQYAGAGYSEYWRERARQYGEGAVVRYISVDDPRTCSPCRFAEDDSPYPATGPFPLPGGDTCRGRGHCRCRLEFEHRPNLFASLTQE